MKKTTLISLIIPVVMAGCGNNKQSTNELITIDVTASYPKKELILQDFMDVEYIPLETTDEFVCQGLIQDIGNTMIIARNFKQDGDIFIFDRKSGKGLKKINRKGQGHEEYNVITEITLDEDAGELFVNDDMKRKICVYDLAGNFKRKLKHKERAQYFGIYNLDQESLICHDGSSFNKGQSFWIISKQDGSIVKEIHIPFEEKKNARLTEKDEATGKNYILAPSTYYPIIPYLDHWILTELSTDTVYSYSSDHTMTPFLTRIPPIQSMDPEVFIFLGAITKRYYFMEALKKEGDVAAQTGFPSTDLVYDKQEKATFKYIVYNDDYTTKKKIFMSNRPMNNKIVLWGQIEADHLVESYESGHLKDGRLKEIAATLDNDSNPVIMLVTHKK